jgi:PPM family protein phosphatase
MLTLFSNKVLDNDEVLSNNKVLSNDKIVEALTLESAALTDRGQKRAANEDAVFHQSNHHGGLYMVCDGLGGLQAGEKASRLVIDTMAAELDPLLHEDIPAISPEIIRSAAHAADERLKEYVGLHPEIRRMGTTLTLVLVKDNIATIANIGDSRAYLYRGGHVTQITEDHSWAAALARMGKIKSDEIASHPRSNLLYRSLGSNSESELEVDVFNQRLKPGDKLLLCSDGLWHAFANPIELAEWLDTFNGPDNVAQDLVNEAKRRDGSDNISAVVVSIGH